MSKNAPYAILILEKLNVTGRTAKGAHDASVTSERNQTWKYLMLRLPTVFFDGFNNPLGYHFIKEDTLVLV